jgi:peptide/nickel transport system substrate-binding protein
MSIDRAALNKSVFGGTQVVDCQPLPIQSVLHTDVPCTPFDPAAAKKLVESTGVSMPVPVEIMVPTGASSLRSGQVIQSMAEAAGFKVTLRTLDLVSALNLTRAGKFDTFLVGWSGRVDPDGNTNDLLTTGGSNNFSGLADPAVDKLVQDAGATNDPAQRKDLYNQLIRKVADIRPNLYLYHGVRFLGTSTKVQGVVYNPDGIPRFETATVSR